MNVLYVNDLSVNDLFVNVLSFVVNILSGHRDKCAMARMEVITSVRPYATMKDFKKRLSTAIETHTFNLTSAPS